MKKLSAILIAMFLLVGCSGKKDSETSIAPRPESTEPAAIKPVTNDPLEQFYGTWRTSAIFGNGARFDMEQIEALGERDNFDMILVINKDGTVAAYSPQYDQAEEEWTKGESEDSILLADTNCIIEGEELVMVISDDEKLYMAKISDRQDKEIINELIKEESKATVEESEPEPVQPETQEEIKEETSSDTIRPEVRDAIDAYEDFVDEYIAFMEKYAESDGTDLSLLMDYTKFMSNLTEYTDKMEALEDDMTDAEYWYYIEVLNRCNEKMLKAAS